MQPATPALRVLSSHLDTACYNDARLALMRLGAPLRLQIPGLRGIDFILGPERWHCVDREHGDLPIFICSDFVRDGSLALHLPVSCRLHIYHIHAGVLLRTALDGLATALRERLAHYGETGPGASRVAQIETTPPD